jgi:cathepsin L
MRTLALTAVAVAALLLASTVSSTMIAPRASELTKAYTYDMYMEDHGKSYAKGSSDYLKRKPIFEKNLLDILSHNANPKRSYSKGVNRFTDWTETELKGIRGGRHEPTFRPKAMEKAYVASGKPLAANLDYRTAFPNVLTAVKDQGMCGDCWAHAVTEVIESAYAVATGQLFVLSQEQITSCTPKEGQCYGCQGMYPRYALEFAANAPLIMEEWVYPFVSYNGSNAACNNMTNPSYPIQNYVSIMGYNQIAPNRQDLIMDALNTLGPLAILVDAAQWSHYESGVFDGCMYNKNFSLDHAVQLVGYGYDEVIGKAYWIVRNSWSASWGEHGYIRIEKHEQPACGLNQGGMSCFATNNSTQAAPSCGMCGLLTDAQFPNVIVSDGPASGNGQ